MSLGIPLDFDVAEGLIFDIKYGIGGILTLLIGRLSLLKYEVTKTVLDSDTLGERRTLEKRENFWRTSFVKCFSSKVTELRHHARISVTAYWWHRCRLSCYSTLNRAFRSFIAIGWIETMAERIPGMN